MILYCLVCRAPFERTRTKNTCGDECRKILTRMIRSEIDKRHKSKPDAKEKAMESWRRCYYSPERVEARAEKKRLRQEARAAAKPVVPPKPAPKCVVCKADFKGRGPKKTCSKACASQRKAEWKQAYREALAKYPSLRKKRSRAASPVTA